MQIQEETEYKDRNGNKDHKLLQKKMQKHEETWTKTERENLRDKDTERTRET